MFKFAHISDVHLGYVQYGLQERRRDFENAWFDCCNYIATQKVDFVIIGGDLFHHKNPDWRDIEAARFGIDILRSNNAEIFGIYGNHDMPSYTDDQSYLNHFHISNSYMGYSLPYHIHGVNWCGQRTQKEIEKTLDKVSLSCYNILMLHIGVQDIFPNDHGTSLSQEFLLSLKSHFDYIALGHIHKQHIIDNFIYNPGSTEACDSTQLDYDRGIFIVTVNSDRTHSVEKFSPRNRPFFKGSLEQLHKTDIKTKALMYVTINGTDNQEQIKADIIEQYKPLYLSLSTLEREEIISTAVRSRAGVYDAFVEVFGQKLADFALGLYIASDEPELIMEKLDAYNAT